MSDKASIIKEAQKYLARGQLDKAIGEWEKLVKESPDGNAFNTIGDLYLKDGNKKNAIDYFHRAAEFFRQEGFALKSLALHKKILNLNPSDHISLLSLGELNEGKGLVTDAIKFYLAAADSLGKEGNKAKFLEIYEKIISLSPGNISLRSKVADIYIKEGLSQEAAKHYLEIAGIYAEKGESEKGARAYDKVIDLEPLNKGALLGRSALSEKTGNLQLAMEQIQDAINLFSSDPDILLRAAELSIQAEKVEQAREYLKVVLEIEPANIKARKLTGDTYLQEGNRDRAWLEYLPSLDEMILEEKYDDAIRLLEAFKDIDPLETGKRLVSLYRQLNEQPHVVKELTLLADAFLDKGMHKEALHCYREILTLVPDDESVKTKLIELERKVALESVPAGAEKTVEEALIEADIFIRYGLFDKAKDLLEFFKYQDPENRELHTKLKAVYKGIGDQEQAIAECLVLKELFEKAGDQESAQQHLQEAIEINPDDPRLSGMVLTAATQEPDSGDQEEAPSLEDYTDEIAEADFYARQGLIEEARQILEKIQNIFPSNEEIGQKLMSLGQISEPEVEHAEGSQHETEETAFSEVEALEPEEIAEPELDNDVMDIFNEFKKGLEKELEEEDYETHYNLGIAYKEMGLIDDAIREFQTARNDETKFISSSNMLGMCYMEKGVYSLAIETFRGAIEKMDSQDDSYWPMKYDLAEAYEKNGGVNQALSLFTEVYGWNSRFRDVADKIEQLKAKAEDTTDQKTPKDRKDRVSYI